MMKRSVSLTLAAVLLLSLLSGCNLQMTMLPNNTKPTSTKPVLSTDPTEPAETTKPTEAPKPTEPVYLEQPREDPVRPAAMPVDVPNMENGIYATCGNYYYTLYMDPEVANEYVYFYLMSEEPLPDDAEIVTNLRTKHKVNLVNRTPKKMSVGHELQWAVQGKKIDWAKLCQAEQRIWDILLAYHAGELPWEEYKLLYDAYQAERNLITGNDPEAPQKELPVNFNYYEVMIYIPKYQMDEELTFAQLVSGEKVIRDISIGEIRLRRLVDPSTEELNAKTILNAIDLHNSNLPIYGYTEPSVGGDQFVMAAGSQAAPQQNRRWIFLAKEDITLTDVYFFANGGENCKIIGADVLLTPTDGYKATGDPIQVQWTPGTPLKIRKHEMVEIYVYYVDSWYQMVEYAAKHYLVLEYQCGTETGRWLGNISGTRKWARTGELYLWAFTDVDVEGYYYEYLFPLSKHLREIGAMPNITNPNIPAIS